MRAPARTLRNTAEILPREGWLAAATPAVPALWLRGVDGTVDTKAQGCHGAPARSRPHATGPIRVATAATQAPMTQTKLTLSTMPTSRCSASAPRY